MYTRNSAITVIDFETTGTVEGYPSEPWQIGMVFFQNGRVNPKYTFTSLLRVGDRPFNPYAPGRHAQLRAEMAKAPPLQDLWTKLKPWLHGRVLAAHNASTEKKTLGEAFPIHTFSPWIDTLKLIRIAYPEEKSHRLEDAVADLNLVDRVGEICPGLAPHDALYDAVACAVLLEFLFELPEWKEVKMDELIHAHPLRYHRLKAAQTSHSPSPGRYHRT